MARSALWFACTLALWACSDDDGGSASSRGDAGGGSEKTSDAGPSLDAQTSDAASADAGLDASGRLKTFTLRFRATIGDAELRCGQNYPGQGSTSATVTPRDFRFFVQNVSLLSRNGSAVPLVLSSTGNFQTPEIALINFTAQGGECGVGPSSVNTSLTGSAPPGDYTGARITIGVPEQLNHADPTQAPAPLLAPGSNWDWVFGYRFFIAELPTPLELFDPDAGTADGGLAFPGLGLFHLGSTACTKDGGVISCLKPNRAEIELPAYDPDLQTIVVDMGALFAGTDLTQDEQCHSSGAACPSMFKAVGVDWDSGTPTPGQTVFHVE